VPGDHYTLMRNPRYYRARQGLPYLDKVVFSVIPSSDAAQKDLQAGSLDATPLGLGAFQQSQRLRNYTLIYPPAQNAFEALYFNFHNTVLASHVEVRRAMAMAVDQ
jgi:peptide/nickel transport system substrate-binding protein